MSSNAQPDRDYLALAIQYASGVILRDIPAAELTRLSCQRFIDDLKRSDRGEWQYQMDAGAAARVCRFIELMPHVKGHRGLIRLVPPQIFIIVNLYGWLDEEGLRRFRTAYLEMPRKNAKSTLIAPLGLYALALDGEEGAEVYSAATKREQAQIVWGVAKQMAMRTPALRERFGIRPGARAISHAASGSTFGALSRDAKRADGLNISMALVDELHAHPTREMWDVIETATGARMQSLMLAITTAGVDTSGICYEQRAYLVKILQGIQQDETYFGVIYTVDPEDVDNWDDPKVWAKANPLLGISVSVADMKRKADKARSMPSARAAFLRYHLNIWGEGEQQWMSPQRWNTCATTLDLEQLRGKRAVIALDLASKVDVAAAVIAWRDAAGVYSVRPLLWVPEKRLGENDSYYGWHEEGWLLTTPGETIDFEAIEDEIKALCREYDIWAVPYDRFQAVQFATRMTAEKVPMVEFAQVVSKMSEPMKAIEALVIEGKIRHDGNPMMAWMMSNVQVLVDRKDNVYPRKARPENKIDGPVALIMAMAMWLGEEVPKVSKYKLGADLTALSSK